MTATGVARFSLDELSDSSGVSKRTIRYYIAEGVISAAAGRGRSSYYTPTHVRELEEVKTLREQGLSVSEIRNQRTESAAPAPAGLLWERFVPHPALELQLRSDAPPYVRDLAYRLVEMVNQWLGATDDAGNDPDDSVQFR